MDGKNAAKIWPRMKAWFRHGNGTQSHATEFDDEHTGSAAQEVMDGPADEADIEEEHGRSGGGFLKRRREERSLQKLQDGYVQVIDLVQSIQKHQQRQEERAMEISSSLSQMATKLSDIDQGSRDQAEKLARIADELRVGNERAARWEKAIADMPHIAEAQRDALTTVARQMEAVGQRDRQMAESLTSFREAVSSLGDATTASSVAINNLQMATLESQERASTLMKEQNKRFMMLFTVTLVLAGVAIMAGLIVLWKN